MSSVSNETGVIIGLLLVLVVFLIVFFVVLNSQRESKDTVVAMAPVKEAESNRKPHVQYTSNRDEDDILPPSNLTTEIYDANEEPPERALLSTRKDFTSQDLFTLAVTSGGGHSVSELARNSIDDETQILWGRSSYL
tara:strand:- start:23 stop:433 length:411 start_codon:yes stop_codon:yes gene_type:complete